MDSSERFIFVHTLFIEQVQSTPRAGIVRRTLREAAWLAIPYSDRDPKTRYYYEEYSCCPPPLFIPIISLAQVKNS